MQIFFDSFLSQEHQVEIQKNVTYHCVVIYPLFALKLNGFVRMMMNADDREPAVL